MYRSYQSHHDCQTDTEREGCKHDAARDPAAAYILDLSRENDYRRLRKNDAEPEYEAGCVEKQRMYGNECASEFFCDI